jgi:hypothetical protein
MRFPGPVQAIAVAEAWPLLAPCDDVNALRHNIVLPSHNHFAVKLVF